MRYVWFGTLFWVFLCLGLVSASLEKRVDSAILKGQANVVERIHEDGGWNWPPYLGTNFIAEHLLFIHALDRHDDSKIDRERLQKMLLETQEDDGSWFNVRDANVPGGDIDTTLMNYWGLKILGVGDDHFVMKKARSFILQNGGIDSLGTMTKCKLAMFGMYDWDNVMDIPLFIFRNKGLFSYSFAKDQFSQWVYPHLVAIAYLRHFKVHFPIPESWSIRDLYAGPGNSNLFYPMRYVWGTSPSANVQETINRIVEMQQPRGSFGAYTVSTLLSICSLKDYAKRFGLRVDEFVKRIDRGFAFVEELYFDSGEGAYRGVLDWGQYWDSILCLIGLGDTGYVQEDADLMQRAGDYLSSAIQTNGGIPYGYDFEYAIDFDDTAELIIGWELFQRGKQTNRYQKEISEAVDLLLAVQNDDGGYGAFDKNRGGRWIVRTVVNSFANSAELFDQSSVDVTAHVMEAFANLNMTVGNTPALRKMTSYLHSQQVPFGAFEGRWGVNYVYGTGSALVGLSMAKVNMSQKWIVDAMEWLVAKQNKDGGWGESAVLSYRDPTRFAGVGISTPSQTAWAVMGLVAAAHHGQVRIYDDVIESGITYLVNEIEKEGKWFDASCVGTGHRGILNMQYPVYAASWPLMALGRYRAWKQT